MGGVREYWGFRPQYFVICVPRILIHSGMDQSISTWLNLFQPEKYTLLAIWEGTHGIIRPGRGNVESFRRFGHFEGFWHS